MIWRPMHYRTSADGILWSSWQPLLSLDDRLPSAAFVQARILVDGRWRYSPIELWACDGSHEATAPGH